MNNRDYLIILYDYYSELFNEKQRSYFEDYYFNNLSLGEISDNIEISRNAIHKVIKNIEEKTNKSQKNFGCRIKTNFFYTLSKASYKWD